MAKVYSILTQKRLDQQDTKANDELANSNGRYVGCLPKADTDFMRGWQDSLAVEQKQINELIENFELDYLQYLANVAKVLQYFKVDPATFNPEVDNLMIDKDGHCWVTRIEKDSNNRGQQ
jgi:hypothetical protein